MCEAEATSVEHAPPKCIFPESKDTEDGIEYRKNLITVPSCETHNSAKSKDDEYLLHVLAASYTSSNVGLTQFIRKVARAFEKAPSKASSFVRRSTPILIKREEDNEWEHGAKVIVEGERLDRVLSNCARALYFKETGKKAIGSVSVITAFTMYLDPEDQARISSGIEAATTFFSNYPAKGENPEVFWYKFEESYKSATFLMCFYSGSEVLVRVDKMPREVTLP